jgi:hypothetical protein
VSPHIVLHWATWPCAETDFPRVLSFLRLDEVISDLLKPERSNLAIREDRKKGVYVEGLSEWVVRSPKEVYGLIKRGTSLRATGSTRINETSSRSHALFIIIVEQNEMIYEEDAGAVQATPGMDEQEKARAVAGSNTLVRQSFKVGKLNLVDLSVDEEGITHGTIALSVYSTSHSLLFSFVAVGAVPARSEFVSVVRKVSASRNRSILTSL